MAALGPVESLTVATAGSVGSATGAHRSGSDWSGSNWSGSDWSGSDGSGPGRAHDGVVLALVVLDVEVHAGAAIVVGDAMSR